MEHKQTITGIATQSAVEYNATLWGDHFKDIREMSWEQHLTNIRENFATSWEHHCNYMREILKEIGSRLPPDLYALYERSITDRNNWTRGQIFEMQRILDTHRADINDETIDQMEQFIATETGRMEKEAPDTASAELFDSIADK